MRRVTASCLLLAIACSDPVAGPPERRAFFHWRTTLTTTPEELATLRETHAERLYVRFFDVDREAPEAAPKRIGTLSATRDPGWPANLEVVPVVFFRERVFRSGVGELAARTWKEIAAITRKLGRPPREVLLDCDWTDTSREAFFGFVEEFRALARSAGAQVSATIRLHQVKYRERTGIPPADRGLLMFYATGRLTADPATKAIFDPADARRYLERLPDYPLPLDVALPAFGWVVQVREGRVHDLLQAAEPADVAACPSMVAAGPLRWRATEDGFCAGAFVRRDDLLHAEVVDVALAREAARLVAPHLPASPRTVALFDLSPRTVARFGTPGFLGVFDALH